MRSSDAILARLAATRAERKRLREERVACCCERAEHGDSFSAPAQESACWKAQTYGPDGDPIYRPRAEWCASCVRRQELHEQFVAASRAAAAALRVAIARGRARLADPLRAEAAR